MIYVRLSEYVPTYKFRTSQYVMRSRNVIKWWEAIWPATRGHHYLVLQRHLCVRLQGLQTDLTFRFWSITFESFSSQCARAFHAGVALFVRDPVSRTAHPRSPFVKFRPLTAGFLLQWRASLMIKVLLLLLDRL